jgi:MerR family transcriptional regulator, thiopeptide resistance regulator
MPNDLTDVIPVLVYRDIVAAQDYLVATLGFTAAGLHRDPDGRVVHAEVQAGGRRIWLHQISAEHGLDTPQAIGRAAGGIVVHVDDVDAHWARARAAGADITAEPTDQDYGQREYTVRDPEGHQWWIATPTAA